MLEKQDLLNILDSTALAIQRLRTAYGIGTETGSVSKAVKTNFDRIKNLTYFINDFNNYSDLLNFCYSSYKSVHNDYIYLIFRNFLIKIWDIQNNLDTFLTNNDARVFEEIKDIYLDIGTGYTISPSNVLPPPIANMGTYAISSDSGVFTDGEAIDTTKYGKAFLKVKTTSLIGINDLVLTITCKKIDNTTEDKQVTIPANTPSNSEFYIGNETTDMYIDITDITHTGGNDGDSVQCFSIWERQIQE